MGKLASDARSQLANMVLIYANQIRLADEIEKLIPRELLERIQDHAYLDLGFDANSLDITIYAFGGGERALFNDTRRALGLHHMERKFSKDYGQFIYSGTTPDELFGRSLSVRIKTENHAGCEIEAVTEVVSVTKYRARCKETVDAPVEGEDVLPAETPKEVVASGQSSDPASDVL